MTHTQRYFLSVMAAVLMAMAVWLLGARLIGQTTGDLAVAWVPPLWPGGQGYAPVSADNPLDLDIPLGATSLDFTVLSGGDGSATLSASTSEESGPIVEFSRKRDGEHGWWIGGSAVRDLVGGMRPPDAQTPPADEPLFRFRWRLDTPTITVQVLDPPTTPAPSQVAISPGYSRLNFGTDDLGEFFDPAPRPGVSFLALSQLRFATPAGDVLWPGDTPPWWTFVALAFAALAALATFRWGTAPIGAALFGFAAAHVALGWLAAVVFVPAYALGWRVFGAAPARQLNRLGKGAALGSAVALLAVVLLAVQYAAEFKGWATPVLFGLPLLWPAIWWARRRAIPAFPVLTWVFVFVAVLALVEQRADFSRLYAEGRGPSPLLDTWDLAGDTDLGANSLPTLTPLARHALAIGWLGSSSTYGSGLATRAASFPQRLFTAPRPAEGPWWPDHVNDSQVWARPGYSDLQLYLLLTAPHARRPVDALVFYFGGNAGLAAGAGEYYLAQQGRLREFPRGDALRNVALATDWETSFLLRPYGWLSRHSDSFGLLVHRRFERAHAAAFRVAAGDPALGAAHPSPSRQAVLWGLAEYTRRNDIALALVPELRRDGFFINNDYADQMRGVAAAFEHVHFVDVRPSLPCDADLNDWFLDDVHFSAPGHAAMVGVFFRALEPLLATLTPSAEFPAEDGPTVSELISRDSQ
jgi:hypothetical protein